MAIFDFFKKKDVSSSNNSELNEEILSRIITQSISQKANYSLPSLGKVEAYNEIKERDDEFIKPFLFTCINRLAKIKQALGKSWTYGSVEYDSSQIITSLMSQLIRRKIDFTDEELLKLTESYVSSLNKNEYFSGIPYKPLLSKIEGNIRKAGLSKDLKSALDSLLIEETDYSYAELRANNEQIKYLLQGAPEVSADNSDPLGVSIIEFVNSITDKKLKDLWSELIKLNIDIQGKANPSEKWLKEVKCKINEIGLAVVAEKYDEWIDLCANLIRQIHKKGDYHFVYLKDINHDILKGIIWSSGVINNSNLNTRIDEYGLLAFKKLSGVGAISVRTGNACLFCFSILPFKEGISRLTKFKMKIKYPSVLKQVEKYISSVAKKEGYSKDKLEELSVPDFGITSGVIKKSVGDYTANVSIRSINEISLEWEIGDKYQSSIPLKVKNENKEDLNAIKKLIKEIESILPAQRDRIEQLYLKSRTWNFDEWKQLYILHPLVKIISDKLIWHFSDSEKSTQGFYIDNEFVDSNNNPITWLNDSINVQLWHPIGFSTEIVLSWREFLERNQIKQPFKQAYREVYIVTDAELTTHSYSNRFAAHILRQHQFAALCKQRGWIYTLMGNWDSHNTPYINLPLWNIRAEFYVNADWQATTTNETGVFNYISTDQVRFYRNGEQLNMEDVPAIVFTEIMRDVDLFVGVTSIGNDVAWQDSGNQNVDTYWHNYSFAELTESSKIRESVLKRLIPRLKIASQCSFDGKYLIVKGAIRTYKIHIGSGNILMSPNDQYLCIVPGRSNKDTSKVFLPFEGDNMLSIILSKALLLSEDDKIKDNTILSQINKK
jgi:hypothetical protein